MAVATNNNSGTPLLEAAARCPGPHIDIVRYDLFIKYLQEELTKSAGVEYELCGESLIECLVKHRELISGPNLWSPFTRTYVQFQHGIHGTFANLKSCGPTTISFLGKLVPVYCKLCFLSEVHESAKVTAQATLLRLSSVRDHRNEVLEFELRALEYIIENLSTTPPAVIGDICLSPDVSVDIKIAVELLWCHLVLVYAGNRRLLLCNLERFFLRPQDSLNLCPIELRRALFIHGKHDPLSLRKDRDNREGLSYTRKCPITPISSGPSSSSTRTASARLYESRLSRLCWLGALWILDIECNKYTLRWLYKPVAHP